METEAFFAKMEKIKMPFRILILVGTVVVLGGLFVWFVYLPKTTDIAKTRDEITNLEQRLTRAKIKVRSLEKFEAEWAEVDAQFKEALKLLPNEKEIPTLLRTITQLGSDAQLEFRLFSPQSERPQDFYMEIPVAIEVSGNYHNVAVFFDKVGHMERIINILNVSMKPEKARSTRLTTTCDAVTYRFKGEPDATAANKSKSKK
jgi:type IV pilus assembly protein PilO